MPLTEKELKSRDSKRDLSTELLAAVRQMKTGRPAKVHQVEIPLVVSARMKSGLTQSAFAELLGVSVRTTTRMGTRKKTTKRRSKDSHCDC